MSQKINVKVEKSHQVFNLEIHNLLCNLCKIECNEPI